MNRRLRFVLALALAGLLILTASLVMQNRPPPNAGGNEDIEAMLNRLGEQERYFDLTQEHIDFLRKLPVQYDPNMENGATVLNLHRTRFLPARIAVRLWDILFLTEERKSELEASFEIFLAFASLSPGRYSVSPDDVTNYRLVATEDDRVKPAAFQFTEQHLKLLNNANARWDDFYGSLIINPKRPYSDMSYFEIDMADILGMRLERDEKGHPRITSAQQATFDGLFKDLPMSLRIFLKNASIRPGKFYRKPAGWGAWRKISWTRSDDEPA